MSTIPVYIFLLSFYLPSIQNPGFQAKADDSLIRIRCHSAQAPAPCIQCLNSDSRSAHADKYSIAALVIECIDKHAVSLAGNFSALVDRTPEDDYSRQAYEDCVTLFSQARKKLKSAAKGLKNGNYDGADEDVFKARSSNLECWNGIGNGKVKDDEGVGSEMMVFEELSEAAMRIIERF